MICVRFGCAQRTCRDITVCDDVAPTTWPVAAHPGGVAGQKGFGGRPRRPHGRRSRASSATGSAASSCATTGRLRRRRAGCSPRAGGAAASTGSPSWPPGCSAPPASQISLLTDVQVVAAGAGLAAGTVGAESPLDDSLCTVTAAGAAPLVVDDARADERVRDLPPVAPGRSAPTSASR